MVLTRTIRPKGLPKWGTYLAQVGWLSQPRSLDQIRSNNSLSRRITLCVVDLDVCSQCFRSLEAPA